MHNGKQKRRGRAALIRFLPLVILAIFALPASAMAAGPVNTELPKATPHIAREGYSVSSFPGKWTPAPTSYAWHWQRCNYAGAGCANIGGALKASYVPTSADVGYTLRVNVTATTSGGSTDAASEPTSVVLAATAQPVWRIGGKSLAELGLESEYFEGAKAPITLEMANGIKITCTSSTTSGRIVGAASGEISVAPSGCTMVGASKCVIESMPIQANIELVLKGNKVYEKFTNPTGPIADLVTSGLFCSWWGSGHHLFSGSFAAQVGSTLEDVSLPAATSLSVDNEVGTSMFFGEAVGWFNLSTSQTLSGMSKGKTLGTW